MEVADKGWLMIKIGVSGWTFLLVLAHLGNPRQSAIKWLLLMVVVTNLSLIYFIIILLTFLNIYGPLLNSKWHTTVSRYLPLQHHINSIDRTWLRRMSNAFWWQLWCCCHEYLSYHLINITLNTRHPTNNYIIWPMDIGHLFTPGNFYLLL